jgi:hydroxyquinol 1,2-dioxygenase
MIIERQEDVTPAVLRELERAPNARFKEIMRAFIAHMHDFVRESKLTEEEFRTALNYVVALGKASNESHNEAVLISGSLGISSLVCLLNNSDGQTDTDASLLATEGFYENQDPGQADMNLRGKFFTDENGHIAFQSIKPAGYPIPVGGPTGELLRAQGRHNMRPAHLHFLGSKDGFKTLISQIYVADDKNIDSDVQFGVTRHLIGNFVKHEGPAPGANGTGTWYSLDHNFVMDAGPSKLPRAPITGKAQGERPTLPVLERVG